MVAEKKFHFYGIVTVKIRTAYVKTILATTNTTTATVGVFVVENFEKPHASVSALKCLIRKR